MFKNGPASGAGRRTLDTPEFAAEDAQFAADAWTQRLPQRHGPSYPCSTEGGIYTEIYVCVRIYIDRGLLKYA